MSELNLIESLFEQFSGQLHQAGYLACKGQMIDASLIPTSIQRNTRKENAQIEQGDVPNDWADNKRCQKDTDARRTQKNGKSHYGDKNHIAVDSDNKRARTP